jgi:PadR family transcriptional regulator, regulatory protein PadR
MKPYTTNILQEPPMSETYKKEIVQHIIRNLLDIQLLRIIQAQPTWGYKIKKQVESDFNIKIRHGALYPTLNSLEKKGFVESKKIQKDGRARKVYTITTDGKTYLQTYYSILQGQLDNHKNTR